MDPATAEGDAAQDGQDSQKDDPDEFRVAFRVGTSVEAAREVWVAMLGAEDCEGRLGRWGEDAGIVVERSTKGRVAVHEAVAGSGRVEADTALAHFHLCRDERERRFVAVVDGNVDGGPGAQVGAQCGFNALLGGIDGRTAGGRVLRKTDVRDRASERLNSDGVAVVVGRRGDADSAKEIFTESRIEAERKALDWDLRGNVNGGEGSAAALREAGGRSHRRVEGLRFAAGRNGRAADDGRAKIVRQRVGRRNDVKADM